MKNPAEAVLQLAEALFEHPPHVVVHQGVIAAAQVDKAWAVASGEVPLSAAAAQGTSLSIADSVFIAFALNQELEQARMEGQREEEANLSSESCAGGGSAVAPRGCKRWWIHRSTGSGRDRS